jgi:hypothetical protein
MLIKTRGSCGKSLWRQGYSGLSTQAVDNCVGDLCRRPASARIFGVACRRPKSGQKENDWWINDLQTDVGCQGVAVKKVPLRQHCA